MSALATSRWRRMHDFHRILYRIRNENPKMTRSASRAQAHVEYEIVYGRRYRNPGIEFKW